MMRRLCAFQLCLCILITTSDLPMSATDIIILGVSVVWACLTTAVGAVAVSAPHPSPPLHAETDEGTRATTDFRRPPRFDVDSEKGDMFIHILP